MRDPTRTIDGRRTAPAGAVLATGLITLGLATLLNAGSLLETAERQPIGSVTHSVATGVMDPVARFAELTRLDTPRALLERVLGKGDTFGETAAAPPEPTPPPQTAATTTEPITTTLPTTTIPDGDTPTAVVTTTTSTTSTSTTSSTTTTTTIPTPTADAPLTLWIIGDSFMELLGAAIRNTGFDTGVIDSEVDFRFISGLVRPDYFDWPAHIRNRLPEVQPDAVVVMFGGNDGQTIRDPEGWIPAETPEWHARYGEMVGEAMDTILQAGANRIYWIGLPIMRSTNFTNKIIGMNEVYESEAAKRPEVTYVSSFELFQDENGEYSTYLRDDEGSLQRMRAADGAHLLWPGAYRLAEEVLGIIATEWGFELHP